MSIAAYTPSLKISPLCMVSKIRSLPVEGDVLVAEGDEVSYDTTVAKAMIPGEAYSVRVAAELGLFDDPSAVKNYMLKAEKDRVKKDEIIARYSAFFGLTNKVSKAPADGTIEHISGASGEVIVKSSPVPIELKSYIPGKIVKVLPKEGVEVETPAALIQGIFGIGGEVHGNIMMASQDPDGILDEGHITEACAGKIIVGGALITRPALNKAMEIGVKGIIVGGIEGRDLMDLLGQEVGIGITGQENVGLTLVISEGFGRISMSRRTFDLMKKLEGRLACTNGATQIRAGVIRPEVIVPREADTSELAHVKESERGLEPGTHVRIIEGPHFGSIASVVSLPAQLETTETESNVRVLEAKLEDGSRITLPRANVEIIF